MTASSLFGLRRALSAAFVLLPLAVVPAWGADDVEVERMATCQDSWFVWQKTAPALLNSFGEHIRTAFVAHGDDPYLVPRSTTTIASLRVLQVMPGNVGMGVGFSVMVAADFDKAKRIFEKKLGKTLDKCETGDNMKSCELDIAEQKSLTLMAEDSPKSTSTLVGCYYFYEK